MITEGNDVEKVNTDSRKDTVFQLRWERLDMIWTGDLRLNIRLRNTMYTGATYILFETIENKQLRAKSQDESQEKMSQTKENNMYAQKTKGIGKDKRSRTRGYPSDKEINLLVTTQPVGCTTLGCWFTWRSRSRYHNQ